MYTKEQRELMLSNIGGRILCGVKFNVNGTIKVLDTIYGDKGLGFEGSSAFYGWESFEMIPYLRPLSDMTEAEQIEANKLGYAKGFVMDDSSWCKPALIRLMNKYNLDYSGLIDASIALTAPEGMYDNK